MMTRTADVLGSARNWEPCIFTGADRGVGCCLTEVSLREGWKMYAEQFLPSWPWLDELKTKYPDTLTVLPLDVGSDESVRSAAEQVEQLDMLVSNAGIHGGEDEAGLRSVYNVNTLASIRLVEALLPRMEQGMKRLALVSSAAGVITIARREGGWGYTLSKAMLNMTVDCMFRELHPKGYTFRLYHPGWVNSYMGGVKSTHAAVQQAPPRGLFLPLVLRGECARAHERGGVYSVPAVLSSRRGLYSQRGKPPGHPGWMAEPRSMRTMTEIFFLDPP